MVTKDYMAMAVTKDSIRDYVGELMGKAIAGWIEADILTASAQFAGKLECAQHGKQYKKAGWLHRHFVKRHA